MIYLYRCKICNNKQEEHHSYKFVTNDDNDYSKTLKCNSCGNIGSMFRIMQGFYYASYSSSTPEQKREMLKKRSRQHFQKEIKEKFYQMNRKDYIP